MLSNATEPTTATLILNQPYSFLENFLSSRRRNHPDRSWPDNTLLSAPSAAVLSEASAAIVIVFQNR
jgi:hypothetical protein